MLADSPEETARTAAPDLRHDEQVLRLADWHPATRPSSLIVNGTRFHPRDPGAPDGIYVGRRQKRISFVSLTFLPRRRVPIPREVTISGRRLTRRCENYFLPLDATAIDVERLFDHMAPRYERVTDATLNRAVARHLLLHGIDRRTSDAEAERLRVADFGCGSGATWRELERLRESQPEMERIELYGCDLSQKMIDCCRLRGFLQASRSDYAQTSFSTGVFDLVLATFVMHYFVDRAPVSEIARILKPGGIFVAALPSGERHNLDRYRKMLAGEPDLEGLLVSEIETEGHQPRRIPVLVCERANLPFASVSRRRGKTSDPVDAPLST